MGYLIRCLDDLGIMYVIKKGNYRRLTMKYTPLGILSINQPSILKDEVVIDFVEKHLDWITIHKPVRILPHSEYKDNDTYLLLGKEYIMKIIYSNHEEVIKTNNELLIYTRYDKNISMLLENYRYDVATLVFNEMLTKCFRVMEKELTMYPLLIIKKSKTKWGMCYIKENKIMLNISLIHTPLYLIEYVIFHELTHFIHPNHSPKFHETLRRYMPDEVKRRANLKNYCIIYK